MSNELLRKVTPQTLPKAQRTRGLSSYYKFLHKSWSYFIFRISNRYQLQNLNQTWTSQLKLNFKILTKPSFRIFSTKIQLHNLYKTSAEKTDQTPASNLALNSTSKSRQKPCAQSLNKSLAFWPNLSFQICKKLLSTRSSSSTSATETTSTSFELSSSNDKVTSIKSTKRQRVREWVTMVDNYRTRVR